MHDPRLVRGAFAAAALGTSRSRVSMRGHALCAARWTLLVTVAAGTVAGCGATLEDRLAGHLRERDPGRGQPRLEVRQKATLSLGDLQLVIARDVAARHGTQHCVVDPGHVWCGERDQALAELVRTFDLAAHPTRLSEPEWVAVVVHVLGLEGVVRDPRAPGLGRLAPRAPIAPPHARPVPGGGAVIELVHRVGPPGAPAGLERVTVIVRPDGSVRHSRAPLGL